MNQILPFATLGRKYKSFEKGKDRRSDHFKNSEQKPTSLRRRVLYASTAPIFALDLWLRYCVNILPKRWNKTIVITDRYCTDLLLMPHTPLWFKNILLKLFPNPNITFYLYQTAEVLHERRPEEPVHELKRQLNLFEALGKNRKLLKIKTSDKAKDIQKVLTQVMEVIFKEWY